MISLYVFCHLMYTFSNFQPVCCSMVHSNYCFLTCIQISHEARKVVWYSHLFQNFPQFVVIHTVKGKTLFVIIIMPACMSAKSFQLCTILYDPKDCSPPGSSVHGILKGRLLEWVAMPSSKGSSDPGIEPGLLCLLHWQAGSLPLAPPGKPPSTEYSHINNTFGAM